MPQTIPKHQPYPGTVKIITIKGRKYKKQVARTWYFPPAYDFLKHWRVIRYWAQKRHGVSIHRLELLLHLYSERWFTKVYAEQKSMLAGPWNERSFKSLINDGWIVKFREYTAKEKTLYRLSHKAKKMCASVYNKLIMKEKIPVTARRNPMFKATANSTDKIFRHAVRDFNEEVEKSPNYRKQG